MPYTAERPALTPSPEELRARIPGWGVDADPADRPSVPKLQFDPDRAGAHWTLPEQQPEKWPRERSIEHASLTPVFGTSCPPKGVSGAIRKFAYRRFSEGRAAHWLILLYADRVDSVGSHVRSLFTARPDNPIAETGVRAELTHHGVRSRLRRHRSDVVHQVMDPVLVAGPWVATGALAWKAVRAVRRQVTSSD